MAHSSTDMEDDYSELAVEIQSCMSGVNRYNPNNIGKLEEYLTMQIKLNEYDASANLTLLKLYQLNPKDARPEYITFVLLKAIMALPQTDLFLAKCLIDPLKIGKDGQPIMQDDNGEPMMDYSSVRLALELGRIMESCDMRMVWKYLIDHRALIDGVTGFKEAATKYACHIVRITYQTISMGNLRDILGVSDDTKLNNLCSENGWMVNGDTVSVTSHEATVKSKNIMEKLDFEHLRPVLRGA